MCHITGMQYHIRSRVHSINRRHCIAEIRRRVEPGAVHKFRGTARIRHRDRGNGLQESEESEVRVRVRRGLGKQVSPQAFRADRLDAGLYRH